MIENEVKGSMNILTAKPRGWGKHRCLMTMRRFLGPQVQWAKGYEGGLCVKFPARSGKMNLVEFKGPPDEVHFAAMEGMLHVFARITIKVSEAGAVTFEPRKVETNASK